MQGDLEKTTHFSYTIPANTVIAFSCTKLDTTEQGEFAMHVGVDKVDNIDAKMAATIDKAAKVRAELEPLTSSKKFPELKRALLDVLKTPDCLEEMLDLVSNRTMLVI